MPFSFLRAVDVLTTVPASDRKESGPWSGGCGPGESGLLPGRDEPLSLVPFFFVNFFPILGNKKSHEGPPTGGVAFMALFFGYEIGLT
jgi:hypothetical protein